MARFSKYSGAGNDFVIVRGEELGLRDAGALAASICPRSTGVGVDGLITVRSLSEELVRVRFFNPDGSEFSTCGNGSRCAARYAVDRGLVPREHVLVTDDGEIVARVGLADGAGSSPGARAEGGGGGTGGAGTAASAGTTGEAGAGDDVALEYALDARVVKEFRRAARRFFGIARTEVTRGWLVRMGTPHVVLPFSAAEFGEFDDLDDFENFCRPLRSHPELGPDGANIHGVARVGDALFVRSFERGVEAETLACGSGCMAVAFALRTAAQAGHPVATTLLAGDRDATLAGSGDAHPASSGDAHPASSGDASPASGGDATVAGGYDANPASSHEKAADAGPGAGAPVALTTRSGAVLRVEFLEAGRIRLSGPAVFLFDGVFPEAAGPGARSRRGQRTGTGGRPVAGGRNSADPSATARHPEAAEAGGAS